MKKVTITELAKTAGVSSSTISRYLKKEKVREDLALKIEEAIKITGFYIEAQEEMPKVEKKDGSVEEKKDIKSLVKQVDNHELATKFKTALKKSGSTLDKTKQKLMKSAKNLKKSTANADLGNKFKDTLGKTTEKIGKTKDKLIERNAQKKTIVKEDIVIEVPHPVISQERKSKKEVQKKRVIRQKKGYTFAILTKDVTNPRSRKLIKAMQSICYEYDCLFTICVGEGNAAIEEKCLQQFIKAKVNAVIVESCGNPKGIVEVMAKANIPTVFLNCTEKGLVSLAVDEKQAGKTLGSYIMERRHLIIRYLGVDEAMSSAHYEGIKKVYHDHKQPLDYAIKMSDGSYLDNYEKLKEIFDEKIDLLILERDEMAIPLHKFLKEYHIAVPQNTSVISFGGHAITQVMSPTLACLAFDYNAYAQYVCETVFAMLEGKTKLKMPEVYQIQEGDSVR